MLIFMRNLGLALVATAISAVLLLGFSAGIKWGFDRYAPAAADWFISHGY